mgnify:CR=1 FL=1
MVGMSRHAQVGDMIIRKIEGNDMYRTYVNESCNYIGLVHKVTRGPSGGLGDVYITWSGDTPPDYKEKHGYSALNIHNLRSGFDVIRDGVNIQ